MKIVLAGSWDSRNKGDAGMIIALIEHLEMVKPGCKITVVSNRPDIDVKAFGKPCVVPPIRDAFNIFPKEFGPKLLRGVLTRLNSGAYPFYVTLKMAILWGTAKLLRSNAPKFLLGGSHPAYAAIAEADCVLEVPSGNFAGIANCNWLGLAFHGSQLSLALWLNKKVGICPNSFGPYSGRLLRAMARRLFDNCSFIIFREQLGCEHLQQMGVLRPRMEITADYAFLLHPVSRGSAEDILDQEISGIWNRGDGPLVGMTAHAWSFPSSSWQEREDLRQSYLLSLAGFCDQVVHVLGGSVVILPQNIEGNENRNVPATGRKVKALCRFPQGVHVLDRDLDPRELKALYGLMDACVVSHMHGLIYSTSMLRPTFAVAYEPKLTGMLGVLGMPERMVPIRRVTAESLIQGFTALWADRIVLQEHLARRMPEVLALCERSNEIIDDFLAQLGRAGD